MAKFRPARGRKSAVPQRANAIGCIVLLVILFVLAYFVIYLGVAQG